MTTSNLIEGLQILDRYRTKSGYNIGADHDVIYAYRTNTPLHETDVARMVELGWLQEDRAGDDGEFTAANYDPDESWAAYV